AFPAVRAIPESPITTLSSPPLNLVIDAPDASIRQLNCFHNNEVMSVERKEGSNQELSLTTPANSFSRRFRYNCTAPSNSSGRFFWFSKQWINPAISE